MHFYMFVVPEEIKLYLIVFFQGHFSVAPHHAALPKSHSAFFKYKKTPRALINNIFIALWPNLSAKSTSLHNMLSSLFHTSLCVRNARK